MKFSLSAIFSFIDKKLNLRIAERANKWLAANLDQAALASAERMHRKMLKAGSLRLARTLSGLAIVYSDRGEYTDAERLYLETDSPS